MFSQHAIRALAFAGAVTAAAAASPAMAAILGTASRANNFITSTAGAVALPLSDTGATTLSFTTTRANQKIRIIYNTECGVVGPAGSWVSVTPTVDGVNAAPNSSTGFAFCTATGTSYTWTGAVRQSFYVVPAIGTHTLAIYGQLNAGATSFWQGDEAVSVDSN